METIFTDCETKWNTGHAARPCHSWPFLPLVLLLCLSNIHLLHPKLNNYNKIVMFVVYYIIIIFLLLSNMVDGDSAK